MSININLLLRRDGESLKRQRRARILNFIAIILLIGVGTLSLVLFLFIQNINPSSVKEEQANILQKMNQLQDRQAKFFVASNRLANIQEILLARKDLSKVMKAIFQKTPSRLLIDNMEIDGEIIVISASSPSLSAIGEFINNLTNMVREKEVINSLTLSSLTFDEGKNTYHVSLKSDL